VREGPFAGSVLRLLDFSGAQATRANANALDRSVFYYPDSFEVWIKLPRTDVVGMGDRVSEDRCLSARIALHWHNALRSKTLNIISLAVLNQPAMMVGDLLLASQTNDWDRSLFRR
jgi:hypothetical protein